MCTEGASRACFSPFPVRIKHSWRMDFEAVHFLHHRGPADLKFEGQTV